MEWNWCFFNYTVCNIIIDVSIILNFAHQCLSALVIHDHVKLAEISSSVQMIYRFSYKTLRIDELISEYQGILICIIFSLVIDYSPTQ